MVAILDKFPGTPRPQQEDALLWLEKNWDEADVFIIQAPVATGKSAIAVAIARWVSARFKQKSKILVPSNVLLEQYKTSYPRLVSLQRKDLYRCQRYPDTTPLADANCDYTRKVFERGCEDCCYTKAVRRAHASPFMVCNYWTFMAHRLFAPVVIMDEAHNLIRIIRDMEGKKLWRKDYHYPTTITTYGSLLKWVENHPNRETDKKLKLLLDELQTGRRHYLVESSVDLYHGREEDCIKLLPIDVRNSKPHLWPHGKVQKLVLMSATFTPVDLEMLGLSKRRVAFFECGSPIPADQRPVTFHPLVNSSFAFQEAALPKLAAFLKDFADERPGVKGFVHTTYTMAAKLERLLRTDRRFVFHTSETKTALFEMWKNGPAEEGKIFVGCGMDEGVDLKGPEFGWQILTKAQYANLSETAIRFQAEENPKEYTWDAMRKCAQATGRICRGPDDYGETVLVDVTFKRLFRQANTYGIVPVWLKEQVTNMEELLE